jgi:hypothetical protein
MTVPVTSRILQRLATRGIVADAIPPLARSAIPTAWGPEIRIIDMAPTPVGVAMAAIVVLCAEAIDVSGKLKQAAAVKTISNAIC